MSLVNPRTKLSAVVKEIRKRSIVEAMDRDIAFSDHNFEFYSGFKRFKCMKL
jgi:hypothetical protein